MEDQVGVAPPSAVHHPAILARDMEEVAGFVRRCCCLRTRDDRELEARVRRVDREQLLTNGVECDGRRLAAGHDQHVEIALPGYESAECDRPVEVRASDLDVLAEGPSDLLGRNEVSACLSGLWSQDVVDRTCVR